VFKVSLFITDIVAGYVPRQRFTFLIAGVGLYR